MSEARFGPAHSSKKIKLEPATPDETIDSEMEVDNGIEAAVPPFLSLPLHIREKIYGELLSMKSTRVVVPHEDWDACEMLDSHYNSPIATDLPDVSCPRVTRYNFDTAILSVNRQINKEAKPFLGWKNQWVMVKVSNATLAKELQIAGSAIPIEAIGNVEKFSADNRAAFEITVSAKPCRGAAGYHQMVMGINGVHDLVTILLGGKWEPWCIMVLISKEHIFPKSNVYQIECRVLDMFQPLRIRSRPYNSLARSPGPLMMLETFDVNSHTTENILTLKNPFNSYQVLVFLRQLLSPYPAEREFIDWKAEAMIMSDWSFYFHEALTKYADTMEDERVSSLWRDTLCMAHARLMVINLGLGRLEQATFHSTRTWEMVERISPMIWYYRRAIDVMGSNPARYSKSVTEEILDIGWCMSRLEHRHWVAFLWLWARDQTGGEADMMAMLSHKMEAARLLAGSAYGSWEHRLAIFDQLMEAQVGRLIDRCSEEQIGELIAQRDAIAEEAAEYNSLESICAQLSVPMWILN